MKGANILRTGLMLVALCMTASLNAQSRKQLQRDCTRLEAEVDSLRAVFTADSTALEMARLKAPSPERLQQLQSERDELRSARKAFIWRECIQRKEILSRAFSQIEIEEVESIVARLEPYVADAEIRGFIDTLRNLQRGKVAADELQRLLDSPYDADRVAGGYELADAPGTYSPEQEEEIRTALSALDAYPEGIRVFESVMSAIDERLKTFRAGVESESVKKMSKEWVQEILGKNETAASASIGRVPYLRKLYRKYQERMLSNPLRHAEDIEQEVHNMWRTLSQQDNKQEYED